MIMAAMGIALLLAAACCRPARKARPTRKPEAPPTQRAGDQNYRVDPFPFK